MKPMKMEEFGIKTWERQKNTHSFFLFIALYYRESKAETC